MEIYMYDNEFEKLMEKRIKKQKKIVNKGKRKRKKKEKHD